MGDVAGETQHVAGRELEPLADDEDSYPSREQSEELARVPGRCGVPRIDAPGSKSISVSNSSGTGSGHERAHRHAAAACLRGHVGRSPAPDLCAWRSVNSSRGIASALAALTSTVSDGLPTPNSRLAIVERGTAAAFASAACVSARECRGFEIAREIRGDEVWRVHRIDYAPARWTIGLGLSVRMPIIVTSTTGVSTDGRSCVGGTRFTR